MDSSTSANFHGYNNLDGLCTILPILISVAFQLLGLVGKKFTLSYFALTKQLVLGTYKKREPSCKDQPMALAWGCSMIKLEKD